MLSYFSEECSILERSVVERLLPVLTEAHIDNHQRLYDRNDSTEMSTLSPCLHCERDSTRSVSLYFELAQPITYDPVVILHRCSKVF